MLIGLPLRAGASGVLGRSTIRQLVAHGHRVVGLVRSEEKARVVKSLGAQPVLGDIFDPVQMRDLVGDAEAVLHLATAIPTKPKTSPRDWVTNDRLRREGTRNLVEACRGRQVRAFIQQSVAYVYGDVRGEWLDESVPLRPISITQSAVDAERIVLEAYREWGLPAVVLRDATFYHAESWQTRYFVEQIKRRRLPIIGDGSYDWHYVHVDDMAQAILRAIENVTAAAGETFFVADDGPFQASELLNFLADRLGVSHPMRIPVWLARLVAGSLGVDVLTISARYCNDKIKSRLGWSPQFPTYGEGFAEVLSKIMV